jgi:ribose transport system permease protein
VIITGGIELSVGSMIALLGAIFIDLIVNHDLDWRLAVIIIVLGGCALGSVHGLLVTKMRLQPFVVTLCGLLIYRGIARYYTQDATAGFGFGESFPTLEWLTTGRLLGIVPNSMIALVLVAVVMGVVLHRSVYGRYLFAGREERGGGPLFRHPHRPDHHRCLHHLRRLAAVAAIFIAMYTRSISPAVHGSFYELYAIAAAVLGGCSLRAARDRFLVSCSAPFCSRCCRTWSTLLGIPSSLNFAVMGTVILIGVIADQQIMLYRQRSATARGRLQAAATASQETAE